MLLEPTFDYSPVYSLYDCYPCLFDYFIIALDYSKPENDQSSYHDKSLWPDLFHSLSSSQAGASHSFQDPIFSFNCFEKLPPTAPSAISSFVLPPLLKLWSPQKAFVPHQVNPEFLQEPCHIHLDNSST